MSIKKLHEKLIRKKYSISVVESCTGGLLSSKLTEISGSSNYFQMGFVTYSNIAKIKTLKINKKIIEKYGAVSSKCCKAMVENLSKKSKSKINISITGIAGPKGGSKEKPVGLVYIGLKKGNKTIIKQKNFSNKGRKYIRNQTVKNTITLILNNL